MQIPLKTYIAQTLINKRVHFRCDCVLNIDVIGVVVDWNLYQNEIIWSIQMDDGKIIKLGENHPKLNIKIL